MAKKIEFPRINLADYPFMMTSTDVAEFLQCGRTVVYQYMRLKDFPTVEIQGIKRVNRDRLQEWIDNNTRKANHG